MLVFQLLAEPLAGLFGMAGGVGGEEIKGAVVAAIRIASLGYLFMAFSVAVQGVLQALGYAMKHLIISALRLAVIVFPAVWLLTLTDAPASTVWWAFPIAEVVTAGVSAVFLRQAYKKKISKMDTP